MKRRSVLIAVLLSAWLVQTAAAVERIEIFSDEALTQTTLDDTQPRLADVYVAHLDITDTTGCLFRIAASLGFMGVWISDTSEWDTFGDTQSGFSFSYGLCMSGSAVIVKVTYQLFGTSTCSSLRTAGHPIVIVDFPACDHCFGEYGLPSNSLFVNCLVSTETTTWGKVKALYR